LDVLHASVNQSNDDIDLRSKPVSKVLPEAQTTPTPPPESLPKTDKEDVEAKARIVFGSRLAGPAERKATIEARSKVIAGIQVPPRPTEPDNCCMSGCVNCVWDVYRDDLEEWAAKSKEARAALQGKKARGLGTGLMTAVEGTPQHVATSMDDDGGGSEASWTAQLGTGKEDLFGDIPVGIREFMRTEKKLKQQHAREASTG
jgi:predicted  nucleic acid-binding Zn-ribbon protein